MDRMRRFAGKNGDRNAGAIASREPPLTDEASIWLPWPALRLCALIQRMPHAGDELGHGGVKSIRSSATVSRGRESAAACTASAARIFAGASASTAHRNASGCTTSIPNGSSRYGRMRMSVIPLGRSVGLRAATASSRVWRQPLESAGKYIVYEPDDHRSVTDRAGHAVGRASADVARREHAGPRRLEQVGLTV